jgi:NAD-dependent dihydropyrimidine dehydrogenase PreA subunit
MRTIGDYPGVPEATMAVARLYSSTLLLGPPMCDELVALVEHMFTEEEAEIVRHLRPLMPMTAKRLAKSTGRPLREVEDILEKLANEKHILVSFGRETRRLYTVMPIVPGTFESVLVRKSADSVTPWHVRFAELYENLYSTGFIVDYYHKPMDSVRYLPVGEALEAQPMALPSDRLENILDRYQYFAVGLCQCRLSKQLAGDGCDKPQEVCTVMGDMAPTLVEQGRMRPVGKSEVLEIKRAAEKEGLVTWIMNEESGRFTNCSCSCCGCCCGAMRSISQFNTPGFIAPPHFMPRIDRRACTSCGKCSKACPMGAFKVFDLGGKIDEKHLLHRSERCIGCGLCVVACPEKALGLEEVEGYQEPPKGWGSYLAKYARNLLVNNWKVRSQRKRQPRA